VIFFYTLQKETHCVLCIR